jgi:DNA replication protein DnaC
MELDSLTAAEPQSIGQVLARSTILPSKSAQDSDPVADRWKIEEQKREQAGKERRRNNVWKALVDARGPRYAKATLANYVADTTEQQAARAAVAEYVKDIKSRLEAGQNVLFIGPAGTGKDHLMMPLCRAAIGEFKTLIWANGTSIWLAFRDAIANDNKKTHGRVRLYDDFEQFDDGLHGSESQIIDRLSDVDVLAISDPLPPGASLTDYQSSIMLQIIDWRYNHLRPTFMTINVANRKEAEQRMGGPTVDRLCHDALTIVCDWPSYRQRKDQSNAS